MENDQGHDDAVGYKRPPKHSRFQKGKCPNPAGRPRGSKDRREVLLRIATEIREVREGSAIKMMTMLEVVLASIRAAAANGSHPAQRLIDRLLSEPPEDEPMIPKGVLIIPEKLTHEEWSERYGQG